MATDAVEESGALTFADASTAADESGGAAVSPVEYAGPYEAGRSAHPALKKRRNETPAVNTPDNARPGMDRVDMTATPLV
jgi:hypothetical protein